MQTLGWDVVAKPYDGVYSPLVHEIDMGIFDYIGERIKGSTILDDCSGTGQMTFKSINKGASKVIAVDSSPGMIDQMKKRKEFDCYNGQLEFRKASILEGVISEVGGLVGGFDIEYFRRCLYFSNDKIMNVLREGYQNLKGRGVIIVVHPEKDLNKYCQNQRGNFTLTHFLRRV